MDYLNETYGSVMITDMATLYNFAGNLLYKDHLYSLRSRKNKGQKAKPNKVRPKWVWRREKTPMAYQSLEWGNVLQMIKTNYWAKKLALFYNRMQVKKMFLNLIIHTLSNYMSNKRNCLVY